MGGHLLRLSDLRGSIGETPLGEEVLFFDSQIIGQLPEGEQLVRLFAVPSLGAGIEAIYRALTSVCERGKLPEVFGVYDHGELSFDSIRKRTQTGLRPEPLPHLFFPYPIYPFLWELLTHSDFGPPGGSPPKKEKKKFSRKSCYIVTNAKKRP